MSDDTLNLKYLVNFKNEITYRFFLPSTNLLRALLCLSSNFEVLFGDCTYQRITTNSTKAQAKLGCCTSCSSSKRMNNWQGPSRRPRCFFCRPQWFSVVYVRKYIVGINMSCQYHAVSRCKYSEVRWFQFAGCSKWQHCSCSKAKCFPISHPLAQQRVVAKKENPSSSEAMRFGHGCGFRACWMCQVSFQGQLKP